jgi:hypothetical protein
MVIRRFFTDPESIFGFECAGKVTTDANGSANITVKGNYVGKIIGYSFTPSLDQSAPGKVISINVHTEAHSAGTTTINIFANEIHDNTGFLAPVAWQGDVYYRFIVSERTLPSTLSTNDVSVYL